MSAKDAHTARNGAVIGGVAYLLFAFVPMFVVASSLLIIPEQAAELLGSDPQKVLPTLILDRMPFFAQVLSLVRWSQRLSRPHRQLFLAPSTSFVENILRHIKPDLNDRQLLFSMRLTIFIFTSLVLTYAILVRGTAIYDMVSAAYQVTLVGAFVPLAFGVYWKSATTQGAISVFSRGGTWLTLTLVSSLGEQFPPQLGGLLASMTGMIVGSLTPQVIKNTKTTEELEYKVHPEHLGHDVEMPS